MGIEFALWGLGGAVVTELVLSVVKRIWLDAEGQPVIKDRWAVVASLVIGIALSGAAAAGNVYPAVQEALDYFDECEGFADDVQSQSDYRNLTGNWVDKAVKDFKKVLASARKVLGAVLVEE